jgi:hypothetical protein
MENQIIEIKKKGRKPLTDEERELRRLDKHTKQKEFYQQNKKYFMMKYNAYLLHDNITLEEVKKKLENSKMNYELLREILAIKEQKILEKNISK